MCAVERPEWLRAVVDEPGVEAAPLAAEYLKGAELTVSVDLGAGAATSTVWTCDLSEEYVRINADYRT